MDSLGAPDRNSNMVGWGSFAPGKGFTVAKTKYGEFNFSAYMLIRYVNQMVDPANRSFTDHTGARQQVDPRQDITMHRALTWFTGWLIDPRLRYGFSLWASGSIQGTQGHVQVTGALHYRFSEHLNLGGGIGSLPGNRSNMGNWPLFLGTDRRMADAYMAPGYGQGIWAEGKIAGRVYYKTMLANNINAVGIDATQLDKRLNTSSTAIWWMPTTGEFGPRSGAFNDYELHAIPATLFSARFTTSTEERFGQVAKPETLENSSIRLSDGTNAFAPNAFAPGVIVDQLNYKMLALEAAVKYKGLAINTEYYFRWLNRFKTYQNAPLPLREVDDQAVQVQVAYQLKPKRLESYLAFSKIFGDYGKPYEIGVGVNIFPFASRNIRLNTEANYLNRAAFGGLFVPYALYQKGTVLHASFEVLF